MAKLSAKWPGIMLVAFVYGICCKYLLKVENPEKKKLYCNIDVQILFFIKLFVWIADEIN